MQEKRVYTPGRVPGKRKVTFYLDEQVARHLRVFAAELGVSQSYLVENLIRSGLESRDALSTLQAGDY